HLGPAVGAGAGPAHRSPPRPPGAPRTEPATPADRRAACRGRELAFYGSAAPRQRRPGAPAPGAAPEARGASRPRRLAEPAGPRDGAARERPGDARRVRAPEQAETASRGGSPGAGGRREGRGAPGARGRLGV